MNMTLSKKDLFDAIRMARPLLILFVCVAHIPSIQGYHSDYDQYDQLRTLVPVFVLDYLTRAAVPILTVFSGYLAYSSFQRHSYKKLIKGKAMRLLLPFLLWNFIAIALFWVYFQFTGHSLFNINELDSVYMFFSRLVGLDLHLPINAPTYFIRDLFVIMLLLPLVHLISKNVHSAVIFCSLYLSFFFILGLPGIVYFSDEFSAHIMFRVDMIVFFILGYFLARHGVQIPKVTSYTVLICTILMAVIGIFVSMYMSASTPSGRSFETIRLWCSTLFVLTAPALLSLLLSIQDNKLGKLLAFLSPYSFTLFLSHIISSQLYFYMVWSGLGWRVNEALPIWQLGIYVLFYCLFVSVGAVVLLTCWLKLKAMLFYRKGNQIRATQASSS